MADTIRILIVEDSPVDAGLVERALHESLESCEFRQVDTRQDYLRAIETFQPHLIVTDYTMPQFDGMTALKLAQQHAPLTPVIIWTSSINEDIAVQCMKAGATNYVLKDNIKRLGPAVLHALEEKKVLLERRQAEDKLRESEEKYRSIVETTTEWIWEMDLNGRHTFSNPSVTAILGYRLEELIEQTAVSLLHAEDRSEVETTLPRLVAEKRG
jgi:DNA-binding NtrC family response regulator